MTEREKARSTRPALEVLDRDQDRLLYDGDQHRDPEIVALSDGFDTYQDALYWYQAAGIRTLGHVEKSLKPEHMLPGGLLNQLVNSQDPYSIWVRRRLVERLDGACKLAYSQFRERANESVQSENETQVDDLDHEKNPLMRPAFERLEDTQTTALQSLWLGFDTRESLGRWVRNLSAPTHGEKPEDLLERIISSPVMLDALLDKESKESVALRYQFAVSEVMPSFFAAARSLHGGERSESSENNGPTFRDG